MSDYTKRSKDTTVRGEHNFFKDAPGHATMYQDYNSITPPAVAMPGMLPKQPIFLVSYRYCLCLLSVVNIIVRFKIAEP